MANNSNLKQILDDINSSLKKAEQLSLHNIVTQIDDLIASVEQSTEEPDIITYREIIDNINQIISQHDIDPLTQSQDDQEYDSKADLDFSLDADNNEQTEVDDQTIQQKSKQLSSFANYTREDGDDGEQTEQGDPDRQGLIRRVPNARLVYKRQTLDNTFEELWIYNISMVSKDMKIRQAILADTDIPTHSTVSPDGTQRYELWSCGNAECLKITGLPE